MFLPFTSPSEFYPGLIIWCTGIDPYEVTTGPTFALAPGKRDLRPGKRDLRPCLVVAVNTEQRLIHVARFCETQPLDTRFWVRIDTAPLITWKNPEAWIWVGPPATLRMVFDRAKVMHAHKDMSYTTPPVCTWNFDAYWIHRTRFLANNGTTASTVEQSEQPQTPSLSPASSRSRPTFRFSPFSPVSSAYPSRAATPIQTVNPWLPRAGVPQDSAQHQYLAPPDRYPYAHSQASAPSPVDPRENEIQSQSLSRHHRSTPSSSTHTRVPTGFIETDTRTWFKNPESGWFWHPVLGLVAPNSPFLRQEIQDS
ncbi:hypothetical protein C8F01DRAFT_1232090 [Mycena amicta]|nr:hypothetical protein C8F01DRAFT_1232090 [Mycena amicta]